MEWKINCIYSKYYEGIWYFVLPMTYCDSIRTTYFRGSKSFNFKDGIKNSLSIFIGQILISTTFVVVDHLGSSRRWETSYRTQVWRSWWCHHASPITSRLASYVAAIFVLSVELSNQTNNRWSNRLLTYGITQPIHFASAMQHYNHNRLATCHFGLQTLYIQSSQAALGVCII